MSISVVLDVALGLLVVFYIMSSLTSLVNEIIGRLYGRRARTMAAFILDAFGNDKATAEKFYGSSVFDKLKAGLSGLLGSIGKWNRIVPGSEGVLYVSTSNFSQATLEALNIGKTVGVTVADVENAINALPANSPLKKALTSAIQQADDKVGNVVTHLEKWFDSQMDQLSNLYKGYARLWLLLIGLLLALFLNVDSIAIFNALENNSALRELAVEQAKTIATQTPESGQATDTEANKKQINDLLVQLNDLGLPLGPGTLANKPDNVSWEVYNRDKALGILITGLAISLGAPFWFDLLKTLTRQ